MTRRKTEVNQIKSQVDETTLHDLFLPSQKRKTTYIKRFDKGYRLQMRVSRNPEEHVTFQSHDYQLLTEAVEALLTARYLGNFRKTMEVATRWRIKCNRVKPYNKGWKLSYKGVVEVFRTKDVALEAAELVAQMYAIEGKQKRDVLAAIRDLRINKDFVEGEAA